MKLIKNIFKLVIFISFIFLFPNLVYADTGNVTIQKNLDLKDALWKPGMKENLDFYINNNSDNDIKVYKIDLDLKSSKDLKSNEKLNLNNEKVKEFLENTIITIKKDNNILFKNTLVNAINEKQIRFSKSINIKKKTKELLNVTIEMKSSTNNKAENLQNIIKLDLIYNERVNYKNSNNLTLNTGGIFKSEFLFLGLIILCLGVIFIISFKDKRSEKYNEKK